MPQPSADAEFGQHAEAKLRAVFGLNRAIGASLTVRDVLPRLLDGLLEGGSPGRAGVCAPHAATRRQAPPPGPPHEAGR